MNHIEYRVQFMTHLCITAPVSSALLKNQGPLGGLGVVGGWVGEGVGGAENCLRI